MVLRYQNQISSSNPTQPPIHLLPSFAPNTRIAPQNIIRVDLSLNLQKPSIILSPKLPLLVRLVQESLVHIRTHFRR